MRFSQQVSLDDPWFFFLFFSSTLLRYDLSQIRKQHIFGDIEMYVTE